MQIVVTGPGRHAGLGLDPVGATEIATYADVGLDTVKRWRERHSDFPQPAWTVGGRPAWRIGDIRDWLRSTGRLPGHNPADRRIADLAHRIRDLLRQRGGWVALTELLPLAPEGRVIAIPELEPEADSWRSEDARGPAYDAGGTGAPDGQAVEYAISLLRRQLAHPDGGPAFRLEEGYPDTPDRPGRSFRIVPKEAGS